LFVSAAGLWIDGGYLGLIQKDWSKHAVIAGSG